MVLVKINSLFRLGNHCRLGYNNEHMVWVMELEKVPKGRAISNGEMPSAPRSDAQSR